MALNKVVTWAHLYFRWIIWSLRKWDTQDRHRGGVTHEKLWSVHPEDPEKESISENDLLQETEKEIRSLFSFLHRILKENVVVLKEIKATRQIYIDNRVSHRERTEICEQIKQNWKPYWRQERANLYQISIRIERQNNELVKKMAMQVQPSGYICFWGRNKGSWNKSSNQGIIGDQFPKLKNIWVCSSSHFRQNYREDGLKLAHRHTKILNIHVEKSDYLK